MGDGQRFYFHLDTPTLSAAFEELKAAGFTAVQADVPDGMDAAAYSAFLDEFGLRPAPGYFGGFFDKSDDLAQTIEAAKQHAATGSPFNRRLWPLRCLPECSGPGLDVATGALSVGICSFTSQQWIQSKIMENAANVGDTWDAIQFLLWKITESLCQTLRPPQF